MRERDAHDGKLMLPAIVTSGQRIGERRARIEGDVAAARAARPFDLELYAALTRCHMRRPLPCKCLQHFVYGFDERLQGLLANGNLLVSAIVDGVAKEITFQSA
jgi:hypothetical protein